MKYKLFYCLKKKKRQVSVAYKVLLTLLIALTPRESGHWANWVCTIFLVAQSVIITMLEGILIPLQLSPDNFSP